MKERLLRGAAPLAATALAVVLVAGPALAGGQDAGENGNPRGGTLSGDAGFAVCMDGAAQQPRCYLAYKDGAKTVVLGQGSDYNGNSIIEKVEIDPAKGDGHIPGTGTFVAGPEGITIHVFFVYLGVMDLTVNPSGAGSQGASGVGCVENNLVYNLGSPNGALHPANLTGNLHVFGQDYPLTASKASAPCGAVWMGPAMGGFYMQPPATAATPV